MVDLSNLYSQHRSAWLRLARRRVGQDAEDVVHDAMVAVLEGDNTAISTLILRISGTTQQRERRRGILHTRMVVEPYTDPPYDLHVAIRRALEQVDGPLVLQAYVQGEPVRKIAVERGRTYRTVSNALSTALQVLANILQEYRGDRKHYSTQRVRVYDPRRAQ